jgi:hypothetical protein
MPEVTSTYPTLRILIREGLGRVVPLRAGQPDDDPWRALAGFGTEWLSTEPGEIDNLVYDQ